MAGLDNNALAQAQAQVESMIHRHLHFANWDGAAAQLAHLRDVSPAFRAAGDTILGTHPHREQLAHAQRAERTWQIVAAALNERNQGRPVTSLRQLRELPHAAVDLRIFDVESRRNKDLVTADVAERLLESLHHGPPALDVVARGGRRLEEMINWLTSHPGRLRSLDVQFPEPKASLSRTVDDEASLRCEAALAQALRHQQNLTELTLWAEVPWGLPSNFRMRLDRGGREGLALADAIAALPRLERLSLRDVGNDAAVLARVLRSLPELKVLNLVASRRNEPGLDAAAFAPVVSALDTLRSLRCLDLEGILPDGTSAAQLADGLSRLTELQTLKLADTGLDTAGLELLARGLAGLTQLHTVDLSGEMLHLTGCGPLFQALADMPALRHLRIPNEACFHADRPSDVAALCTALAPLARRPDVDLHVPGLSPTELSQMQAVLPQVLTGVPPTLLDPGLGWNRRLRSCDSLELP